MSELAQAAGLLVNVLPIVTATAVLSMIEFCVMSKTNRGFSVYLVLPTLIFTLGWIWLSFITAYVPEPYLDEIFHIPQAQTYCRGDFFHWDDKITTPPGLYLATIAATKLKLLFAGAACSPLVLRSFNVWATATVALLASTCRRRLERSHSTTAATTSAVATDGVVSGYSMYTGFNVALFPVLFFFSGLYYTDVASTVSVLLAYAHHLDRVSRPTNSMLSDVCVVILGVLALVMRQTNVFWVVVYMGGLEAVHAIKQLSPKSVAPASTTPFTRLSHVLTTYTAGAVHDPPISACWPDDIIFSLLSIGLAAFFHPLRVLRQVWPHVAVLALFASFVAWNGGVVLGDKANHVATIHLAQMLYIWPLFGLFSAPLFLPVLLSGANTILTLPWRLSASEKTTAQHSVVHAFFVRRLYYTPYIAATFVVSALVVRFNTIVHPFTLADNRHYMFYVFRYTIRRSETLRLLLVLPYSLCRWLVWGALSSSSKPLVGGTYKKDPVPFVNHPILPSASDRNPDPKNALSSSSSSSSTSIQKGIVVSDLLSDTAPCASPSASTVALLLLTTSLSLITAPLVEPRYFLIPWVMWRLLVPAWKMDDLSSTPLSPVTKMPVISFLVKFASRYDIRLFLETAWFLVINAATMYIFIAKAYVWKAEDGSILDGGRLQHFMW
ncbi:hypothetical protein TD95_003036 [Thielaviopsis punctulata]|uniref:Dol-P-Glc:Glc(2)Man(9)GlcNAc(2)-PP-Dol alpha-1,2-glucosyltransferase n=1 Tax=Thielaviopsis punctulata TaxID=72032 RepID=A0A0F4ZCU8_9PEZI|nr:hypothetical protein TD95_003036 [Thielaviopsis punctulata]